MAINLEYITSLLKTLYQISDKTLTANYAYLPSTITCRLASIVSGARRWHLYLPPPPWTFSPPCKLMPKLYAPVEGLLMLYIAVSPCTSSLNVIPSPASFVTCSYQTTVCGFSTVQSNLTNVPATAATLMGGLVKSDWTRVAVRK